MSKRHGPKLTTEASCFECEYCESASYAVQGDSGFTVYCKHPNAPQDVTIGDTTWRTPDWCPVMGRVLAKLREPEPDDDAGSWAGQQAELRGKG